MGKYYGRFALERYRGYCLWAVQRRAVLTRPYPKALACGRTDTEAEAWGRIAEAPAGIKTAGRRLVMRLHPDRGGDHQSFTRAKAAYERLMG